MRTSTHSIRQEMRRRRRATAAQLAEAVGLSLVTVYKELAILKERGEVKEKSEAAASSGGRRARIYESEAGYARRLLLRGSKRGSALHMELEVMDLHGQQLRRETSDWARMEASGMAAWLTAALRRRRVESIALHLEAQEEEQMLRSALQQSFHCPVMCLCPAEALADEQEGTLTLYVQRGGVPSGSMRRHGRAVTCGALHMLPLPAAWSTLDYTDHTLVEEMVARLLQALACVLAPERIHIHADFWTQRLIERIRFNTQSKLKQKAPELHFLQTPPATMESALRRLAALPASV